MTFYNADRYWKHQKYVPHIFDYAKKKKQMNIHMNFFEKLIWYF